MSNKLKTDLSLRKMKKIRKSYRLERIFEQNNISLKKFHDNYKIISALDVDGKYVIVKNYSDFKLYTAVFNEMNFDFKELIRVFTQFEEDKALIEKLNSPNVIKFHEIFVDLSLSEEGQSWKY